MDGNSLTKRDVRGKDGTVNNTELRCFQKIAIGETTDAIYQRFIAVAKTKEYTLNGYSIDNYSFGVLAYDESGNASLISTPTPRPLRGKTPILGSINSRELISN